MSDYLRPEYTPLFTQVQDFIADQLNTDPQLSALGIEFLPEHRLDIEYEIKNNLGKQGTVGIVNTLKGTYGGHNGSTNAWEIEAEIDVLENPPVRRAQMKKMGLSAGSTADILDWVQESMCGPSSPTYGKFCAMSQELGEDRGIIVGRSIMKTFAIADVSAVVSGEHQWICPYALWSDLSALSGQVQDIVVEIDNKRDKMDLSVYDYGAWSLSEYGWNGYEPMTYDPPIQMEYRQVVIDTIGYIWLWITTSETQPDTYFAIRDDNTQAYELIAIGDEFSIITTYTPVMNEAKTQITGFVGDDTPCAASRGIMTIIGDRLAKMSDLSSISPISPYIEDANGNTISADLSCVENHPDWWNLDIGMYGETKILTQVSTDRWAYTEGDNRYVIYIDGTDTWTIEYQQNTGVDWYVVASGTDQSAPRTTNSLTVEMTGDFSDTWTATRPVSYQRKIATEDWVDDKHYVPYTQDRDGYWSALSIGQRNPNYHVGTLSLVVGNFNAAEGYNSFALGASNTLSGSVQGAVAFGQQNVITKTYSTAFGTQNTITGANSLAIGQSNTISAELGVAIGSRNLVGGKYGVAIGGKAQALDSGSFVWGGSDKVNVAVFPIYTSHGKGTFNINPQNGASGFYIGEQSLSSMLSAFITSADVPVPSYIEDANGNKINADRTVQYNEEVANWTDTLYPNDPLNWDTENNWWRADISTSLYMKLQFNSGTWTFEIGENIGGEWVVDSASVQGTQEATFLDFNVAGASHTLNKGVQQIQTTGELALKSYVDGIVGDINTILDNINGEVI